MYKPSFYSGSREQYRHRPIQVITARAFSCKVHEHSIKSQLRRSHNPSNCVCITPSQLNADFALVCITEIWLQKHIPDSILTMQGYSLIHLDRSEAVHRGVCVFLNEIIPFNILDDFADKTYGLEVLWKKNQTNLTPKGIL